MQNTCYKFLLPIYLLMKFGYYTIPFFLAMKLESPYAMLVLSLLYFGYIFWEGRTFTTKITFSDDTCILKPLVGQEEIFTFEEIFPELHTYEGGKFFTTKKLRLSNKFILLSTYWADADFNEIIAKFESKVKR